MTLSSDMDNDMTNVFLNTNEFAETLTWTNDAGTTRSIKGVVWEQRGALDNLEISLIVLHDDATTGVAGTEIQGGQTLTRSNGEIWTILDIQTDLHAHVCRCVLPLERS